MGITCLVIVVKQFEGLLRNAGTARIGMNAKVKGNKYLESYTVYLSSPLTKNEVQKKVLSLEDHLHHSCSFVWGYLPWFSMTWQ